MASLSATVLPPGQYGWIHDLRNVADGTVAGAVALAKSAGLRGILPKNSDGASVVSPNGQPWQQDCRALAPACAEAGLLCIPWHYVYPTDRGPLAALVAQALADTAGANPDGFDILDAEIEFDNDGNAAADAQAVLDAIRVAAPAARLLYTSWGIPDQHPAFPWTQFNSQCEAFLPQVYPSLIGWDPTTCYNRCFLGGNGGGPGVEQMQPTPTVIPTFDLSAPAALTALAKTGHFAAVTFWVMDGMTAGQAQALATTPYAQAAMPPGKA